MASLYEIPIEKINGIGEKRARLYEKLGIMSVGDLIRYYPRTYEDWSTVTDIAVTESGQLYCIKAVVDHTLGARLVAGNKWLSTTTISDNTAFVKLAFFNNPYISNMLKQGREYLFYGKITENVGGREMINPTFQEPGRAIPIKPIYGQVSGLSTKQIEAAVRIALKKLPEVVKDTIPEDIRREYDLIGLKDALNKIHFPDSRDDIQAARRRLIFEELLVLILGLSSIKNMPDKQTEVKIAKSYTDEFAALLPFSLTKAQRRAIDDCVNDMTSRTCAMNRLVQGDVGSGKTMVAAAVAYTCIKNGYQAAIMAPTEILARQHYESFEKLLTPAGVNVALLTGSMTAKQKREVLTRLESGETDLLVGTHALISENVVFHDLGIVITDEQHRFGVRQRSTLLAKGSSPHLLVMSATPIPRTLALMIYGDLDLSIIDELPPGRQKVDTFLIDDTIRTRAYNFLIKNIQEGRQCYIVCPAVENSDTGLKGVEEYAEDIRKNAFRDYRVGVLHGKMKAADKDSVMNEFIGGNIDILVSTTVIEVGVDVPNSTIMMIENADRFGLSQLHQLRGRVGRGQYKSYCILVSDTKGEDAKRRLKALCATNDGFKIADEDLKLRGPGDFFGSRQHGLPELKIADLAENTDILKDAQSAAKEISVHYGDAAHSEYRGLRAEVKMLFSGVGTQLN